MPYRARDCLCVFLKLPQLPRIHQSLQSPVRAAQAGQPDTQLVGAFRILALEHHVFVDRDLPSCAAEKLGESLAAGLALGDVRWTRLLGRFWRGASSEAAGTLFGFMQRREADAAPREKRLGCLKKVFGMAFDESKSGFADFVFAAFGNGFALVQDKFYDAAPPAQPVGCPRHHGLEDQRQDRAFNRGLDLAADVLIVNAAQIGLSAIEPVLDLQRVRDAAGAIGAEFDGLDIAALALADAQGHAASIQAVAARIVVDGMQKLRRRLAAAIELGLRASRSRSCRVTPSFRSNARSGWGMRRGLLSSVLAKPFPKQQGPSS